MKFFTFAHLATLARIKIEAHPSLGWIGSAISTASGFWVLVENVTRIAGLMSVIIGLIAGIYTVRIQKRNWDRNETKTKSTKS